MRSIINAAQKVIAKRPAQKNSIKLVAAKLIKDKDQRFVGTKGDFK